MEAPVADQKRIIARYQPQAWVNDYAMDIDGACEFDVTEAILKMPREKALAIRDDDYDSDNLAIEAGVRGDHNGPFYVAVRDAIHAYFGETL
jgi:hypothetical protein